LRAAVLRRFGAPPALTVESAPDPEVGPGGAVVDVEYAGVTFVDTQVRAGRPPFTPPELPLIPGNGVGGTVIGAVGSARKIPVVEGLGVTAVVDYSRPDWDQKIREEIGAVDVVFDGVGGTVGARAFELVRPSGRFCQYGMASGSSTKTPADLRDVNVLRGTAISPAESHRLSAAALDLAAVGELVPTIGQEYPLEQVAEAHAAIEARATIGKTLLRVAGSRT